MVISHLQNRTLEMIVLIQRWNLCEISSFPVVILIYMLKWTVFISKEFAVYPNGCLLKMQCMHMVFFKKVNKSKFYHNFKQFNHLLWLN